MIFFPATEIRNSKHEARNPDAIGQDFQPGTRNPKLREQIFLSFW